VCVNEFEEAASYSRVCINMTRSFDFDKNIYDKNIVYHILLWFLAAFVFQVSYHDSRNLELGLSFRQNLGGDALYIS